MLLYLFTILSLFFPSYFAHSCFRFCRVSLTSKYYHNNILDLNIQSCSHLILDAYKGMNLNTNLLEKTFMKLQYSNSSSKVKILAAVVENLYSEPNESLNKNLLKTLEKFDGFYFHWLDGTFLYRSRNFYNKPFKVKKDMISLNLKNLRNDFKENNKIIVATLGAEYTMEGYFDYQIFNETMDFVSLETPLFLLHTHKPNLFSSAKQINTDEWSSANSRNKITLDNLASTWIKNGITKERLLVYTEGPDIVEEPRLKTIWASLNNFAGVLYDNLQSFVNPYHELNEMVDNIKKLEKVQICGFYKSRKTEFNLSCYYSLKNKKEDEDDFLKISKNSYQKCQRIIIQKVKMDENNNSIIIEETEKFKKVMEHFQSLNLTETSLILSIQLNSALFADDVNNYSMDEVASKIFTFFELHELEGVELNFDESLDAKVLDTLITKIYGLNKNIQIGLQVNVFKASKLVSIMNNVNWVTHKINPLSDAALDIYYNWNKLHENFGLNLTKVIIKLSPAIWQQTATFPFPSMNSEGPVLEKEDPEKDLILNRKYLCLNETIKQNLPDYENEFLNLPIVFTIHENFEKRKERMLKTLKNENETNPIISLQFLTMDGSIPSDLYHLRYETKEIMEYKIKLAVKHGFGGIALDSINDDDMEGACGKSMFESLEGILEKLNL